MEPDLCDLDARWPWSTTSLCHLSSPSACASEIVPVSGGKSILVGSICGSGSSPVCSFLMPCLIAKLSILFVYSRPSTPSMLNRKPLASHSFCFSLDGDSTDWSWPSFWLVIRSGWNFTFRYAASFEAPSSAGKVVSVMSASVKVCSYAPFRLKSACVIDPFRRWKSRRHEAAIQLRMSHEADRPNSMETGSTSRTETCLIR